MEILLLTVPEAEPGQLAQIRDYALESIGRGLLVLGAEMELARVELDAPPAGAEDPGPEPVPPRRAPSGRAGEKRAILERLRAYREARGLGCFAALAGEDLSEDVLRDLAAGQGRYPMATWRKAARALDAAAADEKGKETLNG